MNNTPPLQQEQERVSMEQHRASAELEANEMGKWEMDTSPYLNRLYHELLGEILVDGIWKRDEREERLMNELGASDFIKEVSSRVSIHMQLSELDQADILEIASRAAEIFADKLEDNWIEWEVSPTQSTMESIAQRLYDILFITLRIAKGGGMKKHRERAKNPYLNLNQPPLQPPQEQTSEVL